MPKPRLGRIQNLIREIPLFDPLDYEEVSVVAKYLSMRRVPTQTYLIREGEVGEFMFFIVEGEVEIRLASQGPQQVVAVYSAGSTVGEMSLLDDYTRSATVLSSKETEILILSRTKFESLLLTEPKLGIKLLKGLGKIISLRLRSAHGRFADFT